jgi:hypothetical protein
MHNFLTLTIYAWSLEIWQEDTKFQTANYFFWCKMLWYSIGCFQALTPPKKQYMKFNSVYANFQALHFFLNYSMIIKNTNGFTKILTLQKKIQYVKIQPFDGKTWSFKKKLVWENSTHMMQYFKSDSVIDHHVGKLFPHGGWEVSGWRSPPRLE